MTCCFLGTVSSISYSSTSFPALHLPGHRFVPTPKLRQRRRETDSPVPRADLGALLGVEFSYHHCCCLLSWSENLPHLPRFLLIALQVLSPCSSRLQAKECTSGREFERRRDCPELQYNTKMASLNTKTFSVVMLEHCTRDLC